MIAACPKCAARYRIERERLEAGGVRLRCARCEAVFRVRPPPEEAGPAPAAKPEPVSAAAPAASRPAPPAMRPAPAPAARSAAAAEPGECVLVAMRESDVAKRTADLLETQGYVVLRAGDGVEAMLEIQRRLPRAVVLAADLPKMFGFQICEILKRNTSLKRTWAVLVGAIHHPDRYRRDADDLYGADAYIEAPDLPDGILAVLARGGVLPTGGAPSPKPAAPAAAKAAPQAGPARAAAPAPAARPAAPMRAPQPAPPAPKPREPEPAPAAARPRRNDGLEDERAKAERLARIVISDIVLYNEERFAAAARAGNVLEAMAGDLSEGRALFDERIDPRVRAERDYLKDELLRNAKLRGMR
jgi:predicted Zn finger-like uncharacterized protein